MRICFLVLTVVVLISQANHSRGMDISAKAISVELGTSYTLHSKILKEDRRLLVHLPDDYLKTDSPYPVVYLLDGDAHFNHAVVAVSMLQDYDMIPDVIVVAITNERGTRNRDLGNQSDNFIRFIKDEVIGFLSGKFRTSGENTLFGHSAAGGFTLSFMRGEHGNLFNHYIAASPAISNRTVNAFEQKFKDKRAFNKSLYFTVGGFAAEQQFIRPEAIKNLAESFEKLAPRDLKWHYDTFPEQGHMTTPYLTLYRGLSNIYHKSSKTSTVTE